jgi:hypothetical protein
MRELSKITSIGIFLASGIASACAADPTGDWRVADGVANIRIAECNGSMWGVVSWEKTPGGRDSNNPDVSKRNRPTLGMPILLDMKKKPGADQWQGQVYNAKDGQTWSRVAGPIPSSPSNSMAKGSPKTQVAPRTTGSVNPNPAAKTSGQKQATGATDAVGDICLLPDIARFAH